MSRNGWVKIYRKTLEHDWLARDPIAKAAWLDILLAADYRGETTARVNLTDIPTRECVTRSVWRRIVARFEAEGMLALEVVRGRGRARGVEQHAWITKFREYQEPRSDGTHVPDARTQQGPMYDGAEIATSTGQPARVAAVNNQCNPETANVTTNVTTNVTAPRVPSGTQETQGFLTERANVTATQAAPSSRSKNLEEDQEESKGDERTMRGASAVASPPTERAHTSSREELDIDHDPPRPPPAPDEIDMDPRLHPEHALMDRLNGKPTAMQAERDARSFFTRLLGAANARDRQVQPRMRAWFEEYGPEYIERVWDEARNAPDPKNPRSSALYYLVDALNGRFYPRAAAQRKTQAGGALHVPDGLVEGQLVLLPNGEQHVLQAVTDVWAYLEGVETAVRPSTLRPVQEVTS